jgi:MFS family permease
VSAGAPPLGTATAGGAPAAREDASSLRRWGVVGLLCVAFIVAFIDRVNLSVALADKGFTSFFGLTDQDRGLLSSAIFWTYAALQIPAGFFVDRVGAKRSMALGFLAWSLISAGAGLAQSMTMLFVIRLMLGVGESVVSPAGMRWIRYNVPEERRGLAIGLFMAAAKIGPAVGTPLSYWLLSTWGWRPMFIALGLGCLVWLVPWMAFVRDDDRHLEAVQRRTTQLAQVSFGAVVRSPVMIGTLIGTFSYQYFNYFCLTWMPAYFAEQHGMSLKNSSLFTSMSYTGFAVVAVGSGLLADRMIVAGRDAVRTRKAFTLAGLLVASSVLVGPISGDRRVALFFTVSALAGLGLTTANYWALTQTLIPGVPVGRVVGLQNMAANVPGIVAPILTGWLKQVSGGYTAPLVAVAVFLVMGVLSYLFLVRPKYAPRAT